MSDEPRAGEWATVVEQHCELGWLRVGQVVKVDDVYPSQFATGIRCRCAKLFALDEPHGLVLSAVTVHPLRWLKRLPPQDEVVAHDRRELERAVDDQEQRLLAWHFQQQRRKRHIIKS